ncbi:hypothetical protein MVES1_002017 [Malassezia vespertilionis]|uniref:uncharacterized protein n=1 Tax=Malassezia vespertilionis TaxID=2020962 RepID=UPI0024B0F170|nr:uncharacterized protein MVES1_002017 [Malassezia vespertilionis]WFD06663.1 hypothetical protein MVES1_002017 [Malassezia vespertilionis]
MSAQEETKRVDDGPNIWIAAGDGDIERVKYLLDSGIATPISADLSGYTPVHAAASYEKMDMLRFLFGQTEDVRTAANACDEDGDTPLFFCEEVTPAKLLVEQFHADATLKNGDGITAAQKAVIEKRTELADYLYGMTGEEQLPRTKLLALVGESDSDAEEEQKFKEIENSESSDDKTNAQPKERTDVLVPKLESIMQDAQANGTDPTEKLHQVVSESIMRHIREDYQQGSEQKTA